MNVKRSSISMNFPPSLLPLAFLNWSLVLLPDLYTSRKSAVFQLIIPALHPRIRAQGCKNTFEVIARFVCFPALLLASMVVEERLVAVTCLVLIGEPGVKWSGLQFNFRWTGLAHLFAYSPPDILSSTDDLELL